MINKNKHYCKYLDAGMDGMKCQKKGLFGECDYYNVNDDKDNYCKMFKPEPNEYDKMRGEITKEIFTNIIKASENFNDNLSLNVLRAWAIEYGVDADFIKSISN